LGRLKTLLLLSIGLGFQQIGKIVDGCEQLRADHLTAVIESRESELIDE
jgi:hypothetical protein